MMGRATELSERFAS